MTEAIFRPWDNPVGFSAVQVPGGGASAGPIWEVADRFIGMIYLSSTGASSLPADNCRRPDSVKAAANRLKRQKIRRHDDLHHADESK